MLGTEKNILWITKPKRAVTYNFNDAPIILGVTEVYFPPYPVNTESRKIFIFRDSLFKPKSLSPKRWHEYSQRGIDQQSQHEERSECAIVIESVTDKIQRPTKLTLWRSLRFGL